MSNKIYSELSHEFIRRMENWGRWSARGGDAQVSPSSMWSSAPSGGYRESSVPLLVGEASDTDQALNSIPVRYRQAVMLFWQYNGQSIRYLARRCCCESHTYVCRVIEGHTLLKAQIYMRTERAREQREQFESLNAA